MKEIVEKVGEALEENFAHLEQLKAEKAKKEKPATNGATNGDVEPSNGTNGDVEMAEEKKAGNLAWPFNLVSSAAAILVPYSLALHQFRCRC